MNNYRIYGERVTTFYVDIKAPDGLQAFQIAQNLDSSKWQEVETDRFIIPAEVIDLADISEDIPQDEDTYPEMDNKIVTVGQN